MSKTFDKLTAGTGRGNLQLIPIDDIDIGTGRRQLDAARVTPLMESIKEIGLRTPITVCFDEDESTGTPMLVTGLHRLTACQRLGWTQIDAFVTTLDDLQREVWEIDENLMRAELNEMERAEHHKRRKELLEAKGTARRHGGDRRSSAHIMYLPSYAEQAADRLHQHPSTVRRAVRRAEQIDRAVAEAIKGTRFADKGVELDALAAMNPADQMAALRLVTDGDAPDFRSAKQMLAESAESSEQLERANDRVFESMKRQWIRAEADVQHRFVSWLEMEGHFDMWRPTANHQPRRTG